MTCVQDSYQPRKIIRDNGAVDLHSGLKPLGQAHEKNDHIKLQVGIDFEELSIEIREIATIYGHPGVMVKYSEIMDSGRGYLLPPIRDFGGFGKVAERMELEKRQRSTGKPVTKFDDLLAQLKVEVEDFIGQHGTAGVMPYAQQFRKHGREELLHKLHKFGNLPRMAKIFGLKWVIQ